MARFIIKRVLWMIPVLFGVCFIVFTLLQLSPGDPIEPLLPTSYTQEQYEQKKVELGLDKPFFTQFFIYIKNIVTRFDLGTSYQTRRSVSAEILERFPITISIGLLSVLITVCFGIPIGVYSAVKQYSIGDYIITTLTVLFAALPNFWLALMLMLLFALTLRWVPASGLATWKAWILPLVVQSVAPICMTTRLMRSNMLEVIRQDYIRTARSKGVSERTVIFKHALKNATLPVVTMIGMQIGMVIGGSVITESIFAIPGLGMLMVTAINNRNYPVILGSVFFLCIVIGVMNLVVDLLYAFLDPRIKAQYTLENARKKLKAVIDQPQRFRCSQGH